MEETVGTSWIFLRTDILPEVNILPEISIEKLFMDHPCGFHGSLFADRDQIGADEDRMDGINFPVAIFRGAESFEYFDVAPVILFQPVSGGLIMFLERRFENA